MSVEAAYFAQHPTTYDDDPQDKETGRKASQSREAGWMLINYTGVIVTIKGSSPTETNAAILIYSYMILHPLLCCRIFWCAGFPHARLPKIRADIRFI